LQGVLANNDGMMKPSAMVDAADGFVFVTQVASKQMKMETTVLNLIRRSFGLATLAFIMFVLPAVRAADSIPAGPERKTIVVLGDSLAAGLGVDPAEAFPALLQKKIDALGWNFTVVNAGVSGSTSADGLGGMNWLLKRKVDVLVLELGGNDGLRGIPVASTKTNLQAIVDRVKQRNPRTQIILAGMQMPPNMGEEYNQAFQKIFPDLAAKNGAALIPFLLEGVGGRPGLNQADRIHPTAEGHRIVAENVWKVLQPVLEKLASVEERPATNIEPRIFKNSLGMRFMPVPGTTVDFSIWETRVQDYQVFFRETSTEWPAPDFQPGPTDPAENVSWLNAKKFCAWLTKKERAEGKIKTEQEYRLPTDSEWSVAAGLPAESGATPGEKSGRVDGVYPWGNGWPPPKGAGNYCDATFYKKYEQAYRLKPDTYIQGYDDGYADTSPVGSFAANRFGLYDLGGNVWEWCEDWYDNSHGDRVLRGASFTAVDPRRILSSFRSHLPPETVYANYGFRCVLAAASASP
jgi:acyl-CoA thioesterase-1